MSKTPDSGSNGKKKSNYLSIFDRDPLTGKLIPLPLTGDLWKRPVADKLRDKKSSAEKIKRITNLQPLVFTAADFMEDGDAPKKKKKLNAETARKSFLEPKRTSEKSKNNIRRPSGQYSASKRLSLKKPNKKVEPDQSPLLNLEEVEEDLIKPRSALKGFSFKSTTSVSRKFNFSKETPKKTVTPSRMPVIDEELEPNDTFTDNELKCLASPLKVKNNKNFKVIDFKEAIEVVENVIKKQEDAFVSFSRIHEENTNELRLLLNSLIIKAGKENVGGKFITTPSSGKKDNLRKKVLCKSLKNEIESPRTRSAMSLYNSLRSNNPVLETPRLNRQVRDESPVKVLSDALMKQCLILQGTPVHK